MPTVSESDLQTYLERYGAHRLDIAADAEECERDLSTFIQRAWTIIDPAKYLHNWHCDAISDHLMAVSDGEIRRLLINVSPRTGKSAIVSMFWPAWVWACKRKEGYPLIGAQVRFLCLSYASSLAMDAARNMYRLINSPWYQERWGSRVQIDPRQDLQDAFANTARGIRYSVGFGGSVLGRGGDVKIIDDPHKPDEVESDLVRGSVIQQYDEELALRVTDPRTSAEVIVMQRLAEDDLSGHILESGADDIVHLCIPMEYDPLRHCVTVLDWEDPRGLDVTGNILSGLTDEGKLIPRSPMAQAEGSLMWPERFPQEEIEKLKARLGPYGYAGRLQQAPVPRGGGILKAEWWRLWRPKDYPDFSTILVSLDTASTEKEENDEAALTAWGAWADDDGRPQIMLIDAWEGRLEFDPLVQRTVLMCRAANGNANLKADILLVEAKNIGHPVMSEIRRLYSNREWATLPFNPMGDKVTRALSIQHMFSGVQNTDPVSGMKTWSGGQIWAPDTEWAQMTIDRCASFPKGKRKGIVDTTTQAIKYLRDNGIILRRDEYDAEKEEEMRYRKPKAPAYDV